MKIKKLNLQDDLDTPFNRTKLTWPIVAIVCSVLVIVGFGGALWSWIFIVVILASLVRMFVLRMDYKFFQEDRISKLKNFPDFAPNHEIEVWEIKCNRAFRFFGFDQYANLMVLDIGNNQLLGLSQTFINLVYNLPNTHFTLFVDSSLHELLGEGIEVKGTQFWPTTIYGRFKYEFPDDIFPKHLEIKDGTIEELLDKIIEYME